MILGTISKKQETQNVVDKKVYKFWSLPIIVVIVINQQNSRN